jgi:endonuclease/exonuclease/phosphatase (EEP) superfamily protein YafD
MIRRGLTRTLFLLACIAPVLLLVAAVVRITIADAMPAFAPLFYATPPAVLAVGAGLCAAYWFRHGHRTIAILLGVLGLAAFAQWLRVDWQWRAPTGERGDLRVVLWNVDRPDWRQAGTMRWLAAQDADVIAVAERHPRKKNTMAQWQAAFPGYQLVPAKGETLCLVRGEILSTQEGMRSQGSFATAIHARIRGRELIVLQVDINAKPRLSRAGPLNEIAAIADRYRENNLLLLGDFNTPADSVLLRPLRREMTNAFEAAGSGCKATWPMPFPVLSLDQVWTNARLRPVACIHAVSWRSDHRAVVTELKFAP